MPDLRLVLAHVAVLGEVGSGLWPLAELCVGQPAVQTCIPVVRGLFDRARVVGDCPLPVSRAGVGIAAGETAAYRATCANVLKRFGRAADVETAQQVVWTALFDPKAVGEIGRLVTEADRVAKARPKSATARLTLGATLLRTGEFGPAIETLLAALPDSRDHATHVLLFLTLACQQAGKDDEARRWFDRAAEALDEAAKEREDPQAWDRRLELEILRSEAERVFKQGKP
ncbi:MAG TPA: hypothetical protein VKE94_15825 [Gemmataceae bacterium]|nr:hypothetical protein [Gemmataceae bacterium]